MDALITIYGLLFLLGILGNGALAFSLWWGRGTKSPLLMGLIAADFFVCCLSGPITATLYVIPPDSPYWLTLAQFMQVRRNISFKIEKINIKNNIPFAVFDKLSGIFIPLPALAI